LSPSMKWNTKFNSSKSSMCARLSTITHSLHSSP
jgi:hypothetical protein